MPLRVNSGNRTHGGRTLLHRLPIATVAHCGILTRWERHRGSPVLLSSGLVLVSAVETLAGFSPTLRAGRLRRAGASEETLAVDAHVRIGSHGDLSNRRAGFPKILGERLRMTYRRRIVPACNGARFPYSET